MPVSHALRVPVIGSTGKGIDPFIGSDGKRVDLPSRVCPKTGTVVVVPSDQIAPKKPETRFEVQCWGSGGQKGAPPTI